MKTYKVTTYNDKSSYTVSLDDDGVVDVDGLLPASAENLKFSVARRIERSGLSPLAALGQATGGYSHITEVQET